MKPTENTYLNEQHGVRSVSDLVSGLCSELEEMTAHDILTADNETIERLMKEEGLNSDLSIPVVTKATVRYCKSPHVFRDSLVGPIGEHLIAKKNVLINGPMGSGKTSLIKHLVIPKLIDEGAIPSWITVDCAPLRMHCQKLFQREAVWASCRFDDSLFHQFRREFDANSLLINTICRMLLPGGVIFFDHVEHISVKEGLLEWLTQTLTPALNQKGYRVVMSHRGQLSNSKRNAFNGHEIFNVGMLKRDEIASWFSQNQWQIGVLNEAPIDDVVVVTGGVPRLLRDLVHYSETGNVPDVKDRTILEKFVYHRIHCGMMKEIQRFIRCARELPETWNHLTDYMGSLDGLPVTEQTDLLIDTGVIERTADDEGYQFTALIYEQRVRMLVSKKSLSLLGVRAKFDELHRSGTVGRMKQWPEFSIEPILTMLCSEKHSEAVFHSVSNILLSWKIKTEFYLRDLNNRHLWYTVDNPEKTIPLKSGEMSDFARAVKLGCRQVSSSKIFYIPITGNSGMVEIIVRGSCTTEYRDYAFRLQLECLEGMLRGMKSVLANTQERFSLARNKKYSDAVLFEYKGKAEHSNHVLKYAGCNTIAILDKQRTDWHILRYEHLVDTDLDASVWLNSPNQESLNQIASYPTGAGLVLGSDQMSIVFPHIAPDACVAYIRPVMNGKRLVVFVFDGSRSGAIDGATQKHLGIVALKMSA